MARAESSTHYTFSWRKAFPREIKNIVDTYVANFLADIGVTQHPEANKNRKRREVEKHAIKAANKVAKILGVTGKGHGGKGGSGGGGAGEGKHVKDISITLSDLSIASENLRVEFDEKIENIQANIHNNTSAPIKVLVKMFMTFGRSDIVYEFVEREEEISANSSKSIGTYNVIMGIEKFPSSGLYYIRASLISLMDSPPNEIEEYTKGKIIDRAAKIFWLGEDPPEGGFWEDVIAVDWSDNDKYSLLGEYQRGDRGGYKYYYNVKHPAYEALRGDNDYEAEHIFRLLLQAVVEIDLESDTPVLFEGKDVTEPNLVARKAGVILGNSLYQYHNE